MTTVPRPVYPPHGDARRAYLDLANTISQQADAIAQQKVIGPLHGAVSRLLANVDMLRAWTPDDRADVDISPNDRRYFDGPPA